MAELDNIDVELRHLKMVKSILARHLPYKQVWAYGSRVKWTASETSDLDCTVFEATDNEIANTQEAFDESDIPFEIQLLNWETIPDDFKENIKEQYFILQSKRDWRETTLGEIADSNLSTLNKNYPHDIIQYLDTGSIICGKIEGVQEVALTDAPSRAKRLVQNGDIIYSTVRPIQRHYGFIKNPPDNLVVSTGFSVITANTDKAYPLYLYYFLTSNDTIEALDVIAEASTSAYPSLKPSDIEAQEISLPSLPEQKAIAAVLSSLDDKIDLLHEQSKTLESLAQTLFRQWFIEEAQDDWEEVKLGDIIDIRDGTHDSPKQKDFGKYLITSKHLKAQSIDYDSAYLIAEEDFNEVNRRSKVHKNDILFSMIGTLGAIHYIYYEPDYAIKNIGLFKTSERLWFAKFLYLLLKSSIGQRFIHENAKGSTQEYITLGSLREFEFNYPGDYKVKEFNKVVEPYFDKMFASCRQIKTLESIRDTLLPKLMSGSVRVEYEEII